MEELLQSKFSSKKVSHDFDPSFKEASHGPRGKASERASVYGQHMGNNPLMLKFHLTIIRILTGSIIMIISGNRANVVEPYHKNRDDLFRSARNKQEINKEVAQDPKSGLLDNEYCKFRCSSIPISL
ncbi:hypothetical protein LIER_22005 [Lithospermum erythrorhizon]|uniref:Uncharacterized protein n=1 Tax=Lithospermum erythrorhizon TaxID=34254 RepID=A0AAV3QTT4_LITER